MTSTVGRKSCFNSAPFLSQNIVVMLISDLKLKYTLQILGDETQY